MSTIPAAMREDTREVDAASVPEAGLGEASEGGSAEGHCYFRETAIQLGILENREKETILALGGLLKMLRNEAQCGTKGVSLPGQLNPSSFSGREESCSGSPT